jgi:polysaccharide export outer membrane protein
MWRDRRIHRLSIMLLVAMAIGMPMIIGCAAVPTSLGGGEGQLRPLTIAAIETPEGEQGTQVVIRASRPFSYNLSNHDKPPRVLVEIPNGQFAKLASHIAVNQGVVQAIDLQERGSQAQVEVVLGRLVDYEVQRQDNQLVLRFKDPSTPARPPLQGLEKHVRLPPETEISAAGNVPENPAEYVIGGMDILEINVYQEQDLSGTFRVSASGHIPFPLVGNVQVAGLAPPQAQEKLEALLRDGFLKRPQVAVAVKEYRSKGVSVLGAVNKPGAYQLWGGRVTLLDLLSMAGGVSLEEGSKSLILLRPDAHGETKSTAFNLDRLLKEGDAALNVTVQPHDAIYVAKADAIIVYGEVKNPGTYPLESKAMTVLEALSRAGGLTTLAAPNRTRIIRVDGNIEKTIRVRVGDIIAGERMKDIALQPGDVIVVPESYF